MIDRIPSSLVLLVVFSAVFAAAWQSDRPGSPSRPRLAGGSPRGVAADELVAPDESAAASEHRSPASPVPARSTGIAVGSLDAAAGDNGAARASELTQSPPPSPASSGEATGVDHSDAGHPGIPLAPTSASQANSRSFADVALSLPMPGDIAPGLYRVVDPEGTVCWIRIVASDAENTKSATRYRLSSASPQRRVYEVASSGRRWYFIRIDATSTIAGASHDGVR